ncbi:hypothetical protein EAH68_11600 [Corynebacterium hylobatis]|uniref:Uncharacterized protein n=1 Tax=Corynebacterium hylobatis TaxID=1859290 RepID=A0A3R9ZD88_9CORY|nr:hypothetical protein [Corynebacterium hylobatis]RSZ61718.1 hypothetical protein EAH68_11600 [Corynebacterium hylobatis]
MSESTSTDLAAREKRASARVYLGKQLWLLVAALVLYVVSLVLPQAGQVRGYEVLFQLAPAQEAGIKITEYVYSILVFLGVGVLTTLVLITRRTALASLAWMFTTVGFAYSIFAVWLRQTRPTAEDGVEMNIGFWLSLLAVGLAFLGFAFVVLRRSPEQAEIARARAQADPLDEVGRMQQDANFAAETNPLLQDDRRARASERHRPQDDPQS